MNCLATTPTLFRLLRLLKRRQAWVPRQLFKELFEATAFQNVFHLMGPDASSIGLPISRKSGSAIRNFQIGKFGLQAANL